VDLDSRPVAGDELRRGKTSGSDIKPEVVAVIFPVYSSESGYDSSMLVDLERKPITATAAVFVAVERLKL